VVTVSYSIMYGTSCAQFVLSSLSCINCVRAITKLVNARSHAGDCALTTTGCTVHGLKGAWQRGVNDFKTRQYGNSMADSCMMIIMLMMMTIKRYGQMMQMCVCRCVCVCACVHVTLTEARLRYIGVDHTGQTC